VLGLLFQTVSPRRTLFAFLLPFASAGCASHRSLLEITLSYLQLPAQTQKQPPVRRVVYKDKDFKDDKVESGNEDDESTVTSILAVGRRNGP
jgi:hypothetical protein